MVALSITGKDRKKTPNLIPNSTTAQQYVVASEYRKEFLEIQEHSIF